MELPPDNSKPSAQPPGSGERGMWWYLTVRHRHNWLQLIKYSAVGASGYVVNLVTYSIAFDQGLHYLGAAVVAFFVANLSNFLLNKWWTFPTRDNASVVLEYLRFLAVGLLALVANLIVLAALVEGVGMHEVWAQAIAIILVTPVGFVGNKVWTFEARTYGRHLDDA